MKIYPDLYLESVKNINPTLLKKNNIKGLILDVDNTLIDYYRNMPDGVEAWCKNIKDEGIQCMIVSNSNKKDKVETVAKKLEIKYILFAKKPLKSGFLRAAKQMNLNPEEIAAVGDQIFTDVIGSNRCNMFSILVKPIAKKDLILTLVKRPLENIVIKRYLKKKGK